MRSQAYNLVSSGRSRQTSLFEVCRHRALEIGKAFRRQVREWRRRVRTRDELMTLSDNDLRDIRWTRPEVEADARKPFWRALSGIETFEPDSVSWFNLNRRD